MSQDSKEVIALKRKLNAVKAKKNHNHYIQQRSRARRFVNHTIPKMMASKDSSTKVQGVTDMVNMFKLLKHVANENGLDMKMTKRGGDEHD